MCDIFADWTHTSRHRLLVFRTHWTFGQVLVIGRNILEDDIEIIILFSGYSCLFTPTWTIRTIYTLILHFNSVLFKFVVEELNTIS